MNIKIDRILALAAVLCLALSLSSCGQKGGLTRPEASTFSASNFASGK